MNYLSTTIERFSYPQISPWQITCGIFLVLLVQFTLYAQANISTSEDEKTLIIEDAKESEILSFGKNVIVKQHAKGVFAFGGDIIVEGKVDEDVAVIGGSIIQKEGAFIGGDVIVFFGGAYRPESQQPLRNAGKETIIIAVFEEQFRNFAQNPTQIFSPTLTWGFLAQRLLIVLFWFIISFALTTISPGAVSRAVARFQLSTSKILATGILGFLVTTVGVILSLSFLPNYLNIIILPMGFILLSLASVFGYVTLQVSLGKLLQKQLLPENKHSETLAILFGVIAWTIILSIPYIWTFALVMLFSASIGLVFTARAKNGWQKS